MAGTSPVMTKFFVVDSDTTSNFYLQQSVAILIFPHGRA
jgi:hypothetical protein